jgi:hypothetical protein
LHFDIGSKRRYCSENYHLRDLKILYFRQLLFSILLFSLCVIGPDLLYGQRSEVSATLLGWEQQVRNFMLDRAHNYGGTHFNRGLFRDHINPMSPEHEIDLLTYRFTLIDDYDWELTQNSYRLSIGSLNATDFAVENTIKSDIDINSSNNIIIEGYHAENLRANRLLFHLGYTNNFTGNHHLGFRHTVTNEKSDLDATFFYRYGNFLDGMAEVGLTIMDWPNNVVQGLAEESRNEWNQRYEVTHQYKNSPELLSAKLVSPRWGNFKAELVGGLQTYSRKRVEQHTDTLNFIDEEWAHYLGGLLEYSHRYFTVGLTFQRTFSKLRRIPTANSNYDSDFSNWQISNQAGLYATGRIKSFRMEQWITYGHNIDRLQGEKVPGDLKPPGPKRGFERVPFDYVEKPVMLKSRILFDPVDAGFKTGLEFHAEYVNPQGEKAENGVRNWDFRRIYTIIKNYNERLTYTIGYRFSPNFYFLAGVSYDLDGDKQSGVGLPKATGTPTWFDGGFGRFTISW